VRDIRADCAWIPPHLVLDEHAVAFLLVMSLPGGVAVRLTEYRDDPRLRGWMREWFVARREKLAKVQGELDWSIAFTGLVATAGPGGGLKLGEAMTGLQPHAPDDWPQVPHGSLIDRALQFLSNGEPKQPSRQESGREA
jgi:hypothetical protein